MNNNWIYLQRLRGLERSEHEQQDERPAKRARLSATASLEGLSPGLLASSTNVPSLDVNFPGQMQVISSESPFSPLPTPDLAPIIAMAHSNRLEIQQELSVAKGTGKAYARHVRNYEEFWERYQDKEVERDPTYQRIDAHPIVGAKVSLFLAHEMTRAKQNSTKGELQGSSVGQRSIAQTISALQQYMKQHQHEPAYANSPETRVMLRQQDWVKVYEKKAAVNESQRRRNAHATKAKGTSSDTYTTDEILRMSRYTLEAFGPAPHSTHLGLRDRALLLIPTNTAFRGDSTRRVLWSDFFWKSIPVPLIGEDATLDALVILADQSKTNSTGRIDEHGLFRHRHVELCGFGAIGFHFFSHFHIEKKAPPSFAPDFKDPEFSEHGRRDWYGLHLFSGKPESGKPGGMTPMTYENHRDRIKRMHQDNDVQISAVTHGGRFYAANKAESHGAEEADIKMLGNWKVGDAYEEVYKRKLPVKAMLASAMFNAENLPSYVLPRGYLEPPPDLLPLLFPWAESELTAYHDRVIEHGNKAVDLALKNFLELLIKLRTVILQDAAVLFSRSPGAPLWEFPPFNLPEFRNFSASSVSILEQAEAEAKRKLQCLPETVAASMRGILETIEFQANASRQQFTGRLEYIEGLIRSQSRSTHQKGRQSRQSSSRKDAFSQQQPNSQPHPSHPSLPLLESPTPVTIPSTPAGVSLIPPAKTVENVPESAESMHRVSPSTAVQLVAQALDDPYWPADLLSLNLRSSFILSSDGYDRGRQIESIRKLIIKYGVEKISQHQFEWIKTTRSTPDEWLPIYEFNRNVKTIQDLWDEWTVGLNGCLSIRQLDDGWDARWRRNVSGQKTEAARRKVIINLIEKLAGKPNWSSSLALRFLNDKYPVPSKKAKYLNTMRSFITHLQNKEKGAAAIQEIMNEASNYCH